MEFILKEIEGLAQRIEAYAFEIYGEYDLAKLQKKYREIIEPIHKERGYALFKHQYEFYLLAANQECYESLKAYTRGDYETALTHLSQGNIAYGGCGADYTFKKNAGGKGGKKANTENNSLQDEAITYFLAHKDEFRSKKALVAHIAREIVPIAESTVKRWLEPKNLKKKGVYP